MPSAPNSSFCQRSSLGNIVFKALISTIAQLLFSKIPCLGPTRLSLGIRGGLPLSLAMQPPSLATRSSNQSRWQFDRTGGVSLIFGLKIIFSCLN